MDGDHSGLVLQKFITKARFATIGRREKRGRRACTAFCIAGFDAAFEASPSQAWRVVSITRAALTDTTCVARLDSGDEACIKPGDLSGVVWVKVDLLSSDAL
ncbi:hypothetical protein ASG35_25220 [Burkholderia sp. Leaf177]|nr:hypothetical protein ASG35_25220 [Burkholderia sp. Leaf177]